MNRNNVAIALCCIIAFAIEGCAQKSIVNRWVVAGHYKNGKIIPTSPKLKEYEFLKEHAFNAYENGSIIGNGTYTLANDAKSFILKDGNRSITAKIIKLKGSELNIIFDVINSRNDTIVCFAQGSAQAKQAQENALAYNDIKKYWYEMTGNYQRRIDLIPNLIPMIRATVSADNEILTNVMETRKELIAYQADPESLTKDKVDEYFAIQSKLSKNVDALITYTEGFPDLKKNSGFNDLVSMFPQLEKRIETSKGNFLSAFHRYYGKE